MSNIDINDIVSEDMKTGILLNLSVAKQSIRQQDKLYLNLPSKMIEAIRERVGLPGTVLPYVYVTLFPALKDFVNSSCIMEPNNVNYFLEISEYNRLSIKYQQILGGRFLGCVENGTIQAIIALVAAKLSPEYGDKPVAAQASAKAKSPAPQPAIDPSLKEQLKLLKVEGNRIVLPSQHLDRYADIKSLLCKAQGKYKQGHFVFPAGIDPAEVLVTLIDGGVVNTRKESQSFFTPLELADEVCLAVGPLEGKRTLEPSAGDGALADLMRQRGAEVVVIENFAPNVISLNNKGYDVMARDFLTVRPEEIGYFDAICANPPFTKNADIDHVMHMWSFLKPGGVLSVITSTSWQHGSQKKQRAFAEFLSANDASISNIPAGTFKESGTGVATLHIKVRKAA